MLRKCFTPNSRQPQTSHKYFKSGAVIIRLMKYDFAMLDIIFNSGKYCEVSVARSFTGLIITQDKTLVKLSMS